MHISQLCMHEAPHLPYSTMYCCIQDTFVSLVNHISCVGPHMVNSHTGLLLQEAIAARDQTHGYKLDRSHTFAVTLFDDFERYAKVPEQYQDPAPQPYKPTVRTCSSQGLIKGLIQD